WASWLRVVLGLALIGFGVFRWQTRHRHTKTPAWLRSFSKLTPVRAGVTGAVLGLRPEVLILCAAAGLAIGTERLGAAAALIVGAGYVVGSGSTGANPRVGHGSAGDRPRDEQEQLSGRVA